MGGGERALVVSLMGSCIGNDVHLRHKSREGALEVQDF